MIIDCKFLCLPVMIVRADISYGVTAGRQLPAAIALAGGSDVASGVRPGAVPPVETREGRRTIFKEARGEPTDSDFRRPASMLGVDNDTSVGCGWRLVYESELKQVFLDLVERDSDEVVIRIPHERLVRYLLNVAEAESARRSAAAGKGPLDLLA